MSTGPHVDVRRGELGVDGEGRRLSGLAERGEGVLGFDQRAGQSVVPLDQDADGMCQTACHVRSPCCGLPLLPALPPGSLHRPGLFVLEPESGPCNLGGGAAVFIGRKKSRNESSERIAESAEIIHLHPSGVQALSERRPMIIRELSESRPIGRPRMNVG